MRINKKKIVIIIGILMASSLVSFWYARNKKETVNYSISQNYLTGAYAYENKNKEFTVSFLEKEDESKPWVNFQSGENSLSMVLLDGTSDLSLPGQKKELRTKVQSVKEDNQKKDKLTIEEVLPQTDITYEVIDHGIKEDIVLKDKKALESKLAKDKKKNVNNKSASQGNLDKQELEYKFTIQSDNVEPRKRLEGTYGTEFQNKETKEYAFHFLKPVMIDAKGERSEDVMIEVKEVEDKNNKEKQYEVIIKPSLKWLEDQDRAYPVRIDPSIVHDSEAEFDTGTALSRVESVAGPKVQLSKNELQTDANTVALWHMNETANDSCSDGKDVCDSSGSGNNGNANGTSIVDGKYNKARRFNGSSDYVDMGNLAILNGGNVWTISLWFKSINGGDYSSYGQKIIDKTVYYHDFYLRIDSSGNVYFFTYEGSGTGFGTSSYDYRDSNWHHIAIVKENTSQSGNGKMYIDGNLVASGSIMNMANSSSAVLGYSFSGDSGQMKYFNGLLDEVKISNVARSESEIKSDALKIPFNYGSYASSVLDLGEEMKVNSLQWQENGVRTGDGETPYSTTGLVAQWNFNETSGTTAASSAGSCGSACNGTLTNMTSSGQDAAVNSGWTANNKKWGGGALMFDGSDDYVDVGNPTNLQLNTSFSVGLWFKQNGDPVSFPNLVGHGTGGWSIGVSNESGNVGKFFISQSGQLPYLNSTTVVNKGNWYYLVVTKDNSTTKIYVNGKLESTSISSPNFTFANNMAIGRDGGGTGGVTNGVMDSVNIYNRSLTDNEIISNYQAGNIEFQTRSGSDATPEDGGWEDWKPAGSGTETQIDSMDNASSLTADSYFAQTSTSSVVKAEGTGSFILKNKSKDTPPYTNLALNKSYTKSSGPSYLYPDTNDTELTDGYLSIGWDDGRSFGYDNRASYVTVDLGSLTYIDQVAVHYGNGAAGVFFPSWARILTSEDNVNFTDRGSLQCPYPASGIQAADWCKGNILRLQTRYVRVSTPITYWLMWSEMRVFDTMESVSASNFLGQWHMDETGGTGAYIKDNSGNDNHGTSHGTTLVDGISGKARSFNGSTDYISVTPTGFNISTFSAQFWVKTTTGVVNRILNYGTNGSNTGGWIVGTNSNGTIRYYTDSNCAGSWNELTSTVAVNDGVWHHIAATYDGYVRRLYIDGVLNNYSTHGYCSNPSSAVFNIGSSSYGTEFFNGTIDELGVYKYALSAQEVFENYRLGRDNRFFETISTTDLSTASKVPFYVAADKPGTVLDATIGESAFANYEADANTVGFWHMEDKKWGLQNLKDYSSHGNHAYPVGTTVVDGKIGKGRSFNGSSDYLYFPDNEDWNFGSGEFTIDTWIYPRTASQWVDVMGQFSSGLTDESFLIGFYNQSYNYGGSCGVQSAYTPIFIYTTDGSTDNTVCGNITMTLNTWQHLAVVRNNSSNTIKIYLNGQEIGSASIAPGTTIYNSSREFRIGARSSVNDFYFNGNLDETRISKGVAHSASEIRQAYEVGKRTHSVTVDFAASLDSGNLISDSDDTSFTINSQTYGATNKGDNLYVGEKVIVKENYDGTEYLAQGTVTSVDISSGAVSVAAWDSGSTFPSVGYSANATVFKWQREYWDIGDISSDQKDAINRITFRLTDGTVGRNIYLDDLKSVSSYLTNPSATSNVTSSANRYFQYKAILSTSDSTVTPYLSSVTLKYINPPTNVSATDGTYQDKVVVSWTKSTGATGYRVYRDGVDISGALGDVSSYEDSGATAPALSAGVASATDGTIKDEVALSLEDASNYTSHTYTVKAFDSEITSDDSQSDTGYRAVSDTLSYQWQRSAADSDANYSNIPGATTVVYNDSGAPADGSGRYYRCVVSSQVFGTANSMVDRGYIGKKVSRIYIGPKVRISNKAQIN